MARQVFAAILFLYRADTYSGHSIRDPQVQKRSGFYGGNDRYLGFRHWRYERNLQRGKRGPASPAPISAFGPGGHVDGTNQQIFKVLGFVPELCRLAYPGAILRIGSRRS